MNVVEVTDLGSDAGLSLLNLYAENFEVSEKIPLTDIDALIKSGSGHVLAFFDEGEGEPVAGAFVILDSTYLYIAFLAVASGHQGRGYGTKALELLEEKYAGRTCVLEIQSPTVESGNHRQRIRRAEFYKRAGFEFAPFSADEQGGIYDFMVRGGTVSLPQMQEFLERAVGPERLRQWHMRFFCR
ncbi:MAG: GNAT family N-acetyltransferase [Actinomycetaceae bacterium]|nr:GNAT family N-acetyltransferase [Actinomycetaceae bacterium]